jgi:hypothetical protein
MNKDLIEATTADDPGFAYLNNTGAGSAHTTSEFDTQVVLTPRHYWDAANSPAVVWSSDRSDANQRFSWCAVRSTS